MTRIYVPYTGDLTQYGFGPEHNFFTEATAPEAPTTQAPASPGGIAASAPGGHGNSSGDRGGSSLTDSSNAGLGQGTASAGLPSALGGDDMTGAGRVPNAAVLGIPGPLAGLAYSVVPGLGMVNTVGNIANTAMNQSALSKMGYNMTPAQIAGGVLGVNSYAGRLENAMNAATDTPEGRAALDKGGYGKDVTPNNNNDVTAAPNPPSVSVGELGRPTDTSQVGGLSFGAAMGRPTDTNQLNGITGLGLGFSGSGAGRGVGGWSRGFDGTPSNTYSGGVFSGPSVSAEGVGSARGTDSSSSDSGSSGGGDGDANGGLITPRGGAASSRGIAGLVDNATPGRTDQIHTATPAGSYIIPADVVSGLGQGNTAAGAAALDHFASRAPAPSYAQGGRVVPVRLSGGEYAVPPHVVAGLGGGNVEAGASRLDKLCAMVRASTADRMRNAPPPR